MKSKSSEINPLPAEKPKKKIYKRWWFWVLVVIVIAVIGSSLNGGSDNQNNSSGSSVQSSDPQPSQSGAEADNSAAQSTPESSPVTYAADADSLKQLFTDTLDINQDDLAVVYDDINQCYAVSYHPTDAAWDETDFVRKSISNYILYCQQAYQIDGVTSVDFQVSTNMQDSYGNTNLESVIHIRMVKDNFEKFSWENLEYQGIYDNFKDNCEFFWIYPGILQEIDTSDIYYAP